MLLVRLIDDLVVDVGHVRDVIDHHACKLVTERRGQTPQRMAAAIGLEIGAATERAFDAQQKLAEARARRRELAQAQIARREQHDAARTE